MRALQRFCFPAVTKRQIIVQISDVDSCSFWRFFTKWRRTNEIPFVSFIWPPPTNVLIKLRLTILWIKKLFAASNSNWNCSFTCWRSVSEDARATGCTHLSVVCNYETIMEANGLLDGCIRSAKESKEDGELPHERCICDSELKSKGTPCLLREGARGPVGIGCIILTDCYYLFNCFVLCS